MRPRRSWGGRKGWSRGSSGWCSGRAAGAGRGEFGGVEGGAGGQAQDAGRGVDEVVGVGALDPGAVAAGPGDGAGEVGGGQLLRGAQQELVDRAALGERMRLQGQDVDAAAGERGADGRQGAGLVPYGRAHPPQAGGGGRRGGRAGSLGRERRRITGRCAPRRRRMAVAPRPPGVERRGHQKCDGRGDQQDRAPRAVHDEIGDGVGDRNGAEQCGEFDEVAAPVVAVGTLGGGGATVSHAHHCGSGVLRDHERSVTDWLSVHLADFIQFSGPFPEYGREPPRGCPYWPTRPGWSVLVNSTPPPWRRSRTVSSPLPPSMSTSP